MARNFQDIYVFFSTLTKLNEILVEPISKQTSIPIQALNIIQYLFVCGELNTARDLTKMIGMKSASFSIIIDRLVEDGYVSQQLDKKDKRIKHLFLTEKATPIAKELNDISKFCEKRALQNISKEEYNLMYSILDTATTNLINLKNELIKQKKANSKR